MRPNQLLMLCFIVFFVTSFIEKSYALTPHAASDTVLSVSAVTAFPVTADTAHSVKSPRGAMLRAMVLPGWGQWYNEKHIKSALVFLAEAGCVGGYLYERGRVNDADRNVRNIYRILESLPGEGEEGYSQSETSYYTALAAAHENDREFYRDEKRKYVWWLAGSILYGMLDAYVDAYLDEFNTDMDIRIEKHSKDYQLTVGFKLPADRLLRRR